MLVLTCGYIELFHRILLTANLHDYVIPGQGSSTGRTQVSSPRQQGPVEDIRDEDIR